MLLLDKAPNFAFGVVANAPSPATSGTTLILEAGQGANFAYPMDVVVCPSNTRPTNSNAEIVRITNIVGNTLTITRSQQLTTEKSIAQGWFVFGGPLNKLVSVIDTHLYAMVGMIVPYAGSTPPTGWLIANGNAISRVTYNRLFSICGTMYGVGNGSTTFNLPNLTGRIPVGLDSSQTEFDSIGEKGGEKTHTLTTSQIPSHTHTQNQHSHTVVISYRLNNGTTVAINGDTIVGGGNGALNGDAFTYTAIPTATTSSVVATNQNTGGDTSHNNLQPYISLNYIIRT